MAQPNNPSAVLRGQRLLESIRSGLVELVRTVVYCAGLVTLYIGAAGIPGAHAQTVLSRFEGSTEKGVYEAAYDALVYGTEVSLDTPLERVEGALVSRILVKPQDRSNLEVFRSYQRELEAGGFEAILSATPAPVLTQMLRKVFAAPNPPMNGRSYSNTEGRVGQLDLGRVSTQADYYLVAKRKRGANTLYVTVTLAQYDNLYMVDELTTSEMETGTVTLDEDALRSAIETDGTVAIYGIHFETGSATITSGSAETLAVIAGYLQSEPGSFYVVGHTDDTGSLPTNLDLSERRAAAVREALVQDHGIDGSRLQTRGVGPLAPASTNNDEGGRALNRRVEIVLRLGR